MVKNFVIIGANSDIAKQFIKLTRDKDINLFGVSSQRTEKNFLEISDYVLEKEAIVEYISKVSNPIIIFFNGR